MLLRTEQLTKDYGRFRALDHLDFHVKPGEIVGILGPNGSGKSTALRLMLGFLRPSIGHAWIDGHECWHDSLEARRRVSYLPGELRLYENMTGRQIVDFLSRLRQQYLGEHVDDLARIFDIDVNRPLSQLSSGMKRKVALLQVLLPRTPLVILDEPTNTLDPSMRDTLLAQLLEAKQRGQTVLFSSHVLSEVEHVCDRVAILQRGRLVHWQDMAELRQGRHVIAQFAGEAPLPPLPGVNLIARTTTGWNLDYTGPLSTLLDWLAKQPIADLRVEPMGLARIYQQFHPTLGGRWPNALHTQEETPSSTRSNAIVAGLNRRE